MMKISIILLSMLTANISYAVPVWQVNNKAGGVITLHDTLCYNKQGLHIETNAAKVLVKGCYMKQGGFVYVIWQDNSTDLYLSSDFTAVNWL